MKRKITCSHPEFSAWIVPFPKPITFESCDCGQNWICPICGFGEGNYPCDCNRKRLDSIWDYDRYDEKPINGMIT
jgi:hypothetical protein